MRRLPPLALLLVAIGAAACSSGTGPGWTYAPAPSVTPVPSADASASAGPSASASAAPGASASAPVNPSGSPSSTVVTVAAPTGAATTGFDPTELEGPANVPFTIAFDNQDATAPHNVALSDPSGAAVALGGDTALFTGPGKRDYAVPAVAPGAYTFICQAHPTTMKGTLTVK